MNADRRKRGTWGDLAVAGIILAAAVLLAVSLFSGGETAVTARVAVDGEILLSCRLNELEDVLLFPVEGEYPLTLELSREGVRVLETRCPGEDCLHMGTIDRAGERIVCLPDRMVVSLLGDEGRYDAVTG